MLENAKGLLRSNLQALKQKKVKQDELDGDLEFTTIIGFGSKSSRS
jgi:hypothetical protein